MADVPIANSDPMWVTHDPQTKVNVQVSGDFAGN